jgi:hypothetical protein
MWKLKPDDRLDRWKQFRKRLGTLPLESALAECVDFWQKAPFTPYYLEHADQTNWPDPWQLVYENYYCDLAKALGIVYTLHLSEHGTNLEMSIRVYQDTASRGQYNLAWIDQGKYVLNLSHDEVVNTQHLQQHLALEFKYTSEDLCINKYK